MSEIDEIRENEEANYQLSKKLMGDTVTLAGDVMDLYTVLSEIAAKSPLAPQNEYLTALHFMGAARYQVVMSVLAALRGHVVDALRDTRLAIELCAFAGNVSRQPKLALVWVNAGTTDAAYEVYRKQFGAGKLFPRGQRQWQELRDRYDYAAKVSHPSIFKLAGHSRITRTPEALNIEFHYFQLKQNDASEPTRTFLWVIDTHFRILRIFESILVKAIAHDRRRWNLRIETIDAKLDDHKKKWEKMCAPPATRRLRRSAGGIIIP